MLIPRHSDVYERVNSEARNGRKWYEKICCTKNPAPANRMFLSDTASERNSESLVLFLFRGTEFRVVFSFAEWFGTEFQVFASIFVPRNGIPSCFLGTVTFFIQTFFIRYKVYT